MSTKDPLSSEQLLRWNLLKRSANFAFLSKFKRYIFITVLLLIIVIIFKSLFHHRGAVHKKLGKVRLELHNGKLFLYSNLQTNEKNKSILPFKRMNLF